MWEKEQGILLSNVRHNDKMSIAHIFTKNHGYVSFVFHLAKTGKNSAHNTLLQPLTQLEFDFQFIQTDSLQHLREPKNDLPYTDIPFNPVKRIIALFMSEFLSYSLKGESCNERLFRYIAESANKLDKAKEYSNFHIWFVVGVSQFIGISPNVDDYTPGQYFDLQSGCFTDEIPSHQDFLSTELSYKLYLILSSDYERISETPLTRNQRIQLLHSLNDYFKIHIPSFPTLKSIEILESLFD